MKVDIQEREKNPYMERKELKGTVEHTGEPTPSSESLEEFIAKELSIDAGKVTVDKIFTHPGRQKSRFWAKEEGLEGGEETSETEEEEVPEESEGTAQDPEDVLSGTISEGKEKIEDMENPDYEKLLEIEKDNKDRKGMK
ncbi:MAG: hypothetical protein ABEJ72_08270, partial [Candidatus Aenigmatarchaeota archaeon]